MNAQNHGKIKKTVFRVDEALCTGCGKCVKACPMKILKIKEKKCVMVKEFMCLECGTCMRKCPEKAIMIEGLDDMGTIEDV
jgi:NAD-dependent dihydropyrimidine dehydrogenase PreA subunit